MPKQLLITDFFKPKQQKFITDYFKPKKKETTFSKPHKIKYDPKSHYKQVRHYLNNHKLNVDAAATRDGYYFCATNNFSEYNVYTTMDQYLTVENKKVFMGIGTRVATATIDEDSALEHISVIPRFRRKGIGTNLIRFINKSDTQFQVYGGNGHNSRYRLTEEGAALIKACQNKGILSEEQVILGFVPPSPSRY